MSPFSSAAFWNVQLSLSSPADLTRKILFALRANYYDQAMLAEVVDTLMHVVGAHFTTETVRHIATFLTATLCQGGSSGTRNCREQG